LTTPRWLPVADKLRSSSIWHTGTNGLYDSQVYDPQNPEKYPYFNWRGRYTTDEDGNYDCYCLKPTAYPIPYDYA
jgi:catechol 1,2-dioxygenase